ncbi:MAG: fibronectin type III domain-containing protein [Planctomycetota bacterium]|nr:fibronectin type III domain-containing protein [Planctomycetota bacterium]
MKHAGILALVALAILPLGRAEANEEEAFARPFVHAAETSALVYWQLGRIEEAATGYVEYGLDAQYGQRTPAAEEARWSQFHRLKSLKPDATYHYRMVVIQNGAERKSGDRTFQTRKLKDAVYLPGTSSGATLVLDRAGATYVLSQDFTAPGTAIEIKADDVTLDLDGHTLTFGDDTDKQVYGVHIACKGRATVRNGHIVQGRRSGNYSSCVESRYRDQGAEIFGISTDVHLPNAYPMRFFGRCVGARIHHNLLYSRVKVLESRHYPGNDLLRLDDIGDGVEVHDNLLTEGCHIGMRVSGGKHPPAQSPPQIHHNDVRHHQQYVNGYAFSVNCPKAELHHNKVTSTGRSVHLTGPEIQLHDNWLDTKGHMTLDDMPQGSRPFKERRVELHGIKFEGKEAVRCKVYGNFMRITQKLPDEKWDYVPATPLNVACYLPDAMNEVYGNTFVALTEYAKTHIGEYGKSGQWASSIFFVGMTQGPAQPGQYVLYLHDNTFVSNHLWISAAWNKEVNMTVRIEKNVFKLADAPAPAEGHQPFRGLGEKLTQAVLAGGNTFEGMRP